VPDTVHTVPSIPKTLTGKKLELPVKRMLLGAAAERVASPDALADPHAIDAFAEYARARTPSA
jgi:acetoacetyl-CoA synthetase